MGNLFVGPFGLTDRFGTNIANYDLMHDVGFLDIPSQAAAIFTGLIYHLVLLPIAALGLKAMELVVSPDSLLTPLSELYRRLVDPIFDIVSFPLLAILAVGILFLYISFDTVRYSSSFRQDSERVIIGTALAVVAVVLARDPFGPVAFILRSLRDVIRDMTRGTDTSLQSNTVDSFLAPITQSLSFGAPLSDTSCAQQWSEALRRPGLEVTCEQPLTDVGFGMAGSALLGTIAALALIAFAGLAIFRMAVHLFGGTWRLAVIPYAVLMTIVQRRQYMKISNLLGMAAAHFVMVLVVMVLSLIGPPLFTAFMASIVEDDRGSSGRMAISMVVMALGYAAMTYLLHRVSQSSGTLARTLRLSSNRNLNSHFGAPGGSSVGGYSMLNPRKEDLAGAQASAVAGGAKALMGKVTGNLGATSTGPSGEGVPETGTSEGAGDGHETGAAGVTQDEAVATPFDTALHPDFIVLDEESGQFQTKQGFAYGDKYMSGSTDTMSWPGEAVRSMIWKIGGGTVGGGAEGADDADGSDGKAGSVASKMGSFATAATAAAGAATPAAAVAAVAGAALSGDRGSFRLLQLGASSSGLWLPTGNKGSAMHGRIPLPSAPDEDMSDVDEQAPGDRYEQIVGSDTDPGGRADDQVDIDAEYYGQGPAPREMPVDPSAEIDDEDVVEDEDSATDGGRHRAPDSADREPVEDTAVEPETETRAAAPVEHGVLGGTAPVTPVSEPTTPSPETSSTSTTPVSVPAEKSPAPVEPPRPSAPDYSRVGMAPVDRDMAFLETGDAPAAAVVTESTSPSDPALLGSVTTPDPQPTDYVETASSASVPSVTYVAGEEMRMRDSRMVSAAMGFGDYGMLAADSPASDLNFEVSPTGENIVSSAHDMGFEL